MSLAQGVRVGAADLAGHLHFLHPGDVVCVDSGDRLETLLGSCVAVVLTDPRRTVGAMCHIVHSGRPPAGSAANTGYAEAAFNSMFSMLRERSIDPHQCDAYIFGGGNMFPDQFRARHVGQDNVRWVLEALERERVHVLCQDVGGNSYRRLSWTIGPGAPRVSAVAV